ncbi:Set1C complex subunit Swd2.1 [Schizosaccharomyces cryophilus OY26]|uniref:Set1C complex subunit Swd2.1 n=1 Tax=Schizosaccharomyces cryophilus (strain OY26 / ATCC MYA-4695 / CBS 11777 / NBRC 106824 / NRRL Y48691) TaxID=653667 RepID=S9X772_SCHCR|nr:Set1C complex subunit Swd2.1 [Schizosaccharomyces cryophilus OY26]EPY52937.1 Set1C complex subunit Swd2.1 [Schizosaccharomyces cryophilus OY26]
MLFQYSAMAFMLKTNPQFRLSTNALTKRFEFINYRMTTIPITYDLLSSIEPRKWLRNTESGGEITSVSFDDSGELCLASSTDDSLKLYNCVTGKFIKELASKKYGAHLGRFSHHSNSLIHASTKEDDTIRYLDVVTNRYLRYFTGHKQAVTSLDVSPSDEIFLSASMDNTIRLWDFRSPNCQGLLNVSSPVVAAFDATGLIFASVSERKYKISLYNIKTFDSRPFQEIPLTFLPPHVSISNIEFSTDGRYILLTTGNDYHYVVDTYSGQELLRVPARTNAKSASKSLSFYSSACMSPDSKYLFTANDEKHLAIYELPEMKSSNQHSDTWNMHELMAQVKDTIPSVPQSCIPVTQKVECPEVPSIVRFNPRHAQLVTAHSGVVFWA